ncbi:phosphatase 2C-like domain-containing protein [Mortierella sp. GBAus27b]|nr:phosphatase 2C-like domain-containing protein [Mortierella sp. GBAus27b]
MDADQKTLFYFAIFDGHGGSHTADFLTAHLDEYIENANPGVVPQVVKNLRKIGGYFRHFRPHFLEPFLPSEFDQNGTGVSAERARARQERKVHIKGKGGLIKPMIFIPHPNATEEEQSEDMKTLENQAHGTTATSSSTEACEHTTESRQGAPDKNEEDGDEYDEDEDPFVMEQRKQRNRTSPLPGGTTAYFGTHRSEYEKLVIRDQRQQPNHQQQHTKPPAVPPIPTTMTLEQRLCLSFLQCDSKLIRDKYEDGSTASVVLVQSKGAFWETQDDLDLILAHVGDTRVLLCEAPRGESIQLTTDHHPDAVVETDRIRKMAAYVSADSFGENMFLGHVANTRSLGDVSMKPFGVSAEPELIRRTVKAKEAAFLVLISDGVSSVMSNQEVVDCVKLESNPTLAAANVLNLAEQLGAEDNCTVMVVKLPAWGAEMPDLSKELREYRWQSEAQQSRARRR